MTQKAILKKIIKKAVKNGYEELIPWDHIGNEIDSFYIRAIFLDHKFAQAFWKDEKTRYYPKKIKLKGRNVFTIDLCLIPRSMTLKETIEILNETGYLIIDTFNTKSWEFHLQQTVISKDIIEYLKQFLK